MRTSVVGYPRVGGLRELKFASEKYFRKEISAEQLQDTAAHIRKEQWLLEKASGLDFIPSNDFSFYDNLLDTAVLFNVVPKRYQALNLSPLDTYFAMARGYQGEEGDVKALPMKKWFNTNYHYIVPELETDTEIFLAGNAPKEAFLEARALGVETKPVIVGAYTFLKLCKFPAEKTLSDYAPALIKAYIQLLHQLEEAGAQWIQFDEPCLVYDLSPKDLALFQALYTSILSAKKETHILLQTYFGDIRDCYAQVIALPFDGIGLDFAEGRKTLQLVTSQGFPAKQILFAGVVNGKNIWRNSYAKTLEILRKLQSLQIETVINTSCSLLHVPYSLKQETRLPEAYKSHFAFAQEKLTELEELKTLTQEDGEASPLYQENLRLFSSRPDCTNPAVEARVQAIKETDFVRQPSFSQREATQKSRFKLPLFPTTTIGSFPQTIEVKRQRAAFKKGELSREAYVDFIQKQISRCIALQEEIGLDVLVHGEYERNDMVEYFGEQLDGFLFTEKAWVQSYGTRCVKPPIIWGDVSRSHPLTVSWSTYAQRLTKKPLKGMLTGPVTILNWSFPREDISQKESVFQIALAIRDEVLDLEKNGISIIQVDEAALREKLPLRKSDWYREYLDWAIPAFRLVHSGVKEGTQIHTHMCYSEFTDIIPAIDNMDADVITFEASRSDLQILDALNENHFRTEVGPGVYDIHSPRVPSTEEILDALHKMLKKLSPEKLWVNPDCGLKTRGETETTASLQHLVAAAKALRHEN